MVTVKSYGIYSLISWRSSLGSQGVCYIIGSMATLYYIIGLYKTYSTNGSIIYRYVTSTELSLSATWITVCSAPNNRTLHCTWKHGDVLYNKCDVVVVAR